MEIRDPIDREKSAWRNELLLEKDFLPLSDELRALSSSGIVECPNALLGLSLWKALVLNKFVKNLSLNPVQALALLEKRIFVEMSFSQVDPSPEEIVQKYTNNVSNEIFGSLAEKILAKNLDYPGIILKLRTILALTNLKIPASFLEDNLVLATMANDKETVTRLLQQNPPKEVLRQALFVNYSLAGDDFLESVEDRQDPTITKMLSECLARLEQDSEKKDKPKNILIFMSAEHEISQPEGSSVQFFVKKIKEADPSARISVINFIDPYASHEDKAKGSPDFLDETKLPEGVVLENISVNQNPTSFGYDLMRKIQGSDIVFDRLFYMENTHKSNCLMKVKVISCDCWLPIFDGLLKTKLNTDVLFQEGALATSTLSKRERFFLSALALLEKRFEVARKLIAGATSHSDYDTEKTFVFLTTARGGTLGDLGAASEAIRALKAANPSQKIIWAVNIPARKIVVKDLIPDDVSIIYINSLLEMPLNLSILDSFMHERVVLISYPTFHYLGADELTIFSLFPNVELLNISEYDKESLSGELVPDLRTGVGPQSLGVFIKKSPLVPTDTQESLFLRTHLSPESPLFFGYFNGAFLSQALGFVTPGFFIALAIKKAMHKKGTNITIDIVAPIKEEHLESIKKTLALTGVLEHVKHFEWCSQSELSSERITCANSNENGMVVRLINPFPLSHKDMLLLLQKSDSLCLTTGDSSCIEATEAGKIILYQMMEWKTLFYKAMCDALKSISGNVKPLYDFMCLQQESLSDDDQIKKRFDLMAKLILECGPDLQEGTRLLRQYLLERKNLYDLFPRYLQAKTVFPFDNLGPLGDPQPPLIFASKRRMLALEQIEKSEQKEKKALHASTSFRA